MNPVTLIRQRDLERPYRIAVVGDTILDKWVLIDELFSSQDHCLSARTKSAVGAAEAELPGGAAGAARQLLHWNAEVHLIGPVARELMVSLRSWGKNVLTDLAFVCPRLPVKTRYHDVLGRILFRAEMEPAVYGMMPSELQECRDLAVKAIETLSWDAVFLVDYQKGFLTDDFIRRVIAAAEARKIPVVADPKREPHCFAGALLKVNQDYERSHFLSKVPHIVTFGSDEPLLCQDGLQKIPGRGVPVACRNHVGAGDCFGAHLTLGLALGFANQAAAQFAHAAGRVYVQQLRGRPPWPHEIARDLDPLSGKVIDPGQLRALRSSLQGSVVFTNGVFRLPHAGHAWFMQWARQQGDVLVVGVNNDDSAARQRPGQVVLPLAERMALLAALESVDWIVPFGDDTPVATIDVLQPQILVKGNEYRDEDVPGCDLVEDVRFAPVSPFARHATEIAESCSSLKGV